MLRSFAQAVQMTMECDVQTSLQEKSGMITSSNLQIKHRPLLAVWVPLIELCTFIVHIWPSPLQNQDIPYSEMVKFKHGS